MVIPTMITMATITRMVTPMAAAMTTGITMGDKRGVTIMRRRRWVAPSRSA